MMRASKGSKPACIYKNNRFRKPSTGIISLIVLVLLLLIIAASDSIAWADVGVPPWALQGAVVSHGEGSTQVQMVSEEVSIRIQEQVNEDVFEYGNERYAASVLLSRVEAVFLMRNHGSEAESFDVWFPLWMPYYPWGAQVAPISNFEVWVDGTLVSIESLRLDAQTGIDLVEGQPWAVWPMQFPPDEDVEIIVTYDSYPTGELPYATFQYILETGADWAGTIGSGQVTFVLPYDVDEMNVNPPDGDVYIDGNEVVLSFNELEPTEEDNLSLTILAPDRWREIAPARAEVEESPGSSLGQLRYAHAAMLAVREMKGQVLTGGMSGVYAEAAHVAFETAYAINADAFMVHDAVGYLSLLSYMGAYEAWDPPTDLLALLSSALERQPGAYPEVVEYLQMLSFKWEREFWTEEDGTAHVPGAPSEDLLNVVALANGLSPEVLEYLGEWVRLAEGEIPTPAPTPVSTAESVPTLRWTEPSENEAPEQAGSRFCSGSASLILLPIGLYWGTRKKRS